MKNTDRHPVLRIVSQRLGLPLHDLLDRHLLVVILMLLATPCPRHDLARLSQMHMAIVTSLSLYRNTRHQVVDLTTTILMRNIHLLDALKHMQKIHSGKFRHLGLTHVCQSLSLSTVAHEHTLTLLNQSQIRDPRDHTLSILPNDLNNIASVARLTIPYTIRTESPADIKSPPRHVQDIQQNEHLSLVPTVFVQKLRIEKRQSTTCLHALEVWHLQDTRDALRWPHRQSLPCELVRLHTQMTIIVMLLKMNVIHMAGGEL